MGQLPDPEPFVRCKLRLNSKEEKCGREHIDKSQTSFDCRSRRGATIELIKRQSMTGEGGEKGTLSEGQQIFCWVDQTLEPLIIK